jgi:hypothetical protein
MSAAGPELFPVLGLSGSALRGRLIAQRHVIRRESQPALEEQRFHGECAIVVGLLSVCIDSASVMKNCDRRQFLNKFHVPVFSIRLIISGVRLVP